jgi:hypothetical protein
MAERAASEPAEGKAMARAKQQEAGSELFIARFIDPQGRRWAHKVEYLKHLEEYAWLTAKFGPKDAYSDSELEEMFNDPQLNAILDKMEDSYSCLH